jgi:hypothetical protein
VGCRVRVGEDDDRADEDLRSELLVVEGEIRMIAGSS